MCCVKSIQMEQLGCTACHCKLDTFLVRHCEDGYIDKDELYFLLDRVGTFKKAKWSWSQWACGRLMDLMPRPSRSNLHETLDKLLAGESNKRPLGYSNSHLLAAGSLISTNDQVWTQTLMVLLTLGGIHAKFAEWCFGTLIGACLHASAVWNPFL